MEKCGDLLELKLSRPPDLADWLCAIIDGLYLLGEFRVVVAVGKDAEEAKWIPDFEEGVSECVAIASGVKET